MPPITNLETTYIPGFENPMTTFTIDPSASSNSEGGWDNMQIINSAGNGYGAFATNMGDIAKKIPSKPSLKKSCEKCRKRPDQNGKGYSHCSSCKIAVYCSRDCQTSHWKVHKALCHARVKHLKIEQGLKDQAVANNGPFISQATLRKWYYDNVDIVDYAIVQLLELYKGRTHSLWRTHAAIFCLGGSTEGICDSSSEIDFDDGEAVSFTTLARKDHLDLSPIYVRTLGQGSNIILIFIYNNEADMMLIDSHDLPADEEWATMEKDEMWRMHIRMRPMARMMLEEEKDSTEEP
ncbi:hypothetical protein CPB85DRAFT_244813 [Mucidula mucida]|nr:hypothetical protein CPB85DRAFT_244813 [Mucidula mucida]